jgi:hypothetical protein
MFPFLVVFGAALFVASGYVLAGVAVAHGPALGLRLARLAIRSYGVLFLGFVSPVWRVVARVGAIALAAALVASAIAGAVSAAHAGPLMREPGDVVYQPPFAIRADGRLTLPPGMTPAEAARAYAGPRDYWAATCRATLDAYTPVAFVDLDATRRPYWRAAIARDGALELTGLSAAARASLAPFLEELASLVRCE